MAGPRVTILGCGASGGVPVLGMGWGECDPNEPKNRRTRASILVQQGATTLLVDTSPDMRAQLLAAGIDRLDGVLYTHDHADHTHGINELRMLALAAGRPIDVYGDAATLASLRRRFAYVFEQMPGSSYRPIAAAREIGGSVRIGDIEVATFAQDHGETASLGCRFGPIAYSTDAVALSEAAFAALAGVRVWIVGCLRDEPHPTHAHLDRVLEWIERVGAERAVLTHMSHRLDYEAVRARCPAHVEPGYDGLVIEG